MKWLLFIFCMVTVSIIHAQTFKLTIIISGLKTKDGRIEIGIYNKKEDFPKVNKQYKLFKINAENFSGSYTVSNLPKGEYAVAIFHDKNADGICNTNLLGIPREAYGFSNNIKPVFSAPSFNDCKIALNSDMTIPIKLIN